MTLREALQGMLAAYAKRHGMTLPELPQPAAKPSQPKKP